MTEYYFFRGPDCPQCGWFTYNYPPVYDTEDYRFVYTCENCQYGYPSKNGVRENGEYARFRLQYV